MNELARYMAVGFTAIVIFCLLFYISPFLVGLALGTMLVMLMSLASGYIIVDSYEQWKRSNEKNKSRKTTSSSKDAW